MALGAQLYQAHCQSCHGDRNGVGKIPEAPSHGPGGHTWAHSDDELVEVILNGSPGLSDLMRREYGLSPSAAAMPAFRGKLSERDARAIIAYIETWWPPELCDMRRQLHGVEGRCEQRLYAMLERAT
ncbi:MAG: cytochrome c [Chloroflexota bacterium]|nr:cytochrome c [Chloroflexota bacterium]